MTVATAMANTPRGQLREAVRVVEPGDAAGGQKRSEDRVEQQIELAHGHAEQRRHHQRHHLAHPGMGQIPARPGHQVQAIEEGQLEEELHQTRREHSPGQGVRRLGKVRSREQGCADQADVEKHGRERGHGKAPVAVEHRTAHTGQRYQHQVGERDANQAGSELVLFGLGDVAGGEERRHQGRCGQCQQRQGEQRAA